TDSSTAGSTTAGVSLTTAGSFASVSAISAAGSTVAVAGSVALGMASVLFAWVASVSAGVFTLSAGGCGLQPVADKMKAAFKTSQPELRCNVYIVWVPLWANRGLGGEKSVSHC